MSGSLPPHRHDASPSDWIVRHGALIAPGARVLDLASGSGRHARWLAARGARVLAVDRDREALAMLEGTAGIATACLDLETGSWPLAGERFDAIVVANYFHRPLFPNLLAALADDGTLLYETFARGNERYGRPSNPAFLLKPGELLEVVAGRLTVVTFEQGHQVAEGRDAVIQRIAAVGPARPWPPHLLSVASPA
jgi:SAM-dependent methyltransferase